MRECKLEECSNDISHRHYNTKYCSEKCKDKDRYKQHGQRLTPERRKFLYKKRTESEEYKQKLRDQGNERNKNIKVFLAEYKLEKGCLDCGYSKHHSALDFDHLYDKKFNLSFSKSINQAKEEIKKCEVVCSNCHRIRTYNRLKEKKEKK